MALTTEESKAIVAEVVNQIKAESQSVTELEVVSSLSGVNSLPAMRGTKLVSTPISLLSKPATDAASTASAAANLADAAATKANTAASEAQKQADIANNAAQVANEAAAKSIRKITVKDKSGETTGELTPDGSGNVDLTMIGNGGSGSGFYNVTQLHPLTTGYYTKATAVAALAAAKIDDENKPGMIITFDVSAGKWEDYRYDGTNLDGFLSPAGWNRFGGGDAIKKMTVTKGTQTQELTPDEQGSVNLDVPVVNVDETLDENSTNPVQNKALVTEFKKLAGKYGTALQLNEIVEGTDKAYSLSLLDESGEVLSTSDMFTGGGGSSIATTKIQLTRVTANLTAKSGDEVKLVYTFDHIDTESGATTGNTGHVTITITHGASNYTLEKDLAAGSTDTIDVTKYLGVGSNSVKVRVSVGEGAEQQVSQISWSVSVVKLTLTSSFNFASVINRGDVISVPFALNGSGTKTIRCYVDKIDTEDRSITTSTANGSFSINTTKLTHGSHSVQLVCELELSNGTVIKSNSIYFDIAVRESSNSTPIVATRFDFSNGTIITGNNQVYIAARQYENYNLQYAVYNPKETPTKVEILEGGIIISSAYMSFLSNELTMRAMTSGVSQCKIVCGSTTYYYALNVSQSDLNISEPTDGLQLKLSAQGRSNSDTNKTEWIYNNIMTEFYGVKWGGDGWINNALRLTDGGKAVIKYQPLAQPMQGISNAFAFFVKFQVSEVTDDNAEVIRCVDESGTGFVITAQEARMVTKGKSSLSMKMAAGNTYEVGFVSYPKAGTNSSNHEILNSEMVFLYIDGIASGSVERGTSDSIYQANPQYIELGANMGAMVDVFLMRGYNTYLSDSQVLDCYIVDQDNVDDLVEKYHANDIIDSNGVVSVDSVPDNMRYVIVTGKQANGVATVLQAAVNNDKDPKYDVDEILCIKRSEPALNFRLVGGCVRLQGTSSLAYPIKNYRIYLNSSKKVDGKLYLGCDSQGVGGELQAKAKYSFRLPDLNGITPFPVNCFCLKADYAESSSSHNTGFARLANDMLKAAGYYTPAQKHVSSSHKSDVRTTIDGEPCLLFYRETLEDTPTLVGKFNFNNDKSTEDVFGFLNIPGYHDQPWVVQKFGGVNPTECWEFLNNDYPMGMYLDDDFDTKGNDSLPNWMKVFEARFPDNNDNYEDGTKKPANLMRFVKWVKSTKDNPTKFRNELSEYADVDYMCAYFILTQMFGSVDQMVKNAMIAFYYDPEKDKILAYYIFYDNDTILGVRNDSRLIYLWDVNRQTIDKELSTAEKTVYAYAGHDSVLWNNLENTFSDKLQDAYKRLRKKMMNEYIFKVFDNEQAGRFCERLYNLDAQYKYVRPKTLGIEVNQNGVISTVKYSYLEAMQGSRTAHRRWWLINRLHLFDAKYSTGQYSLTDITWKGNSAVGATVKATPSRDFYFEFRREGTTMQHIEVNGGKEWSYTYDQVANIGTIFHLLGGIFMSKLDLSNWGGFTDVNLPNLPILEELIMGKVGVKYTLTELVIGNKLPMLRKLNIQNYTRIPSLDLTSCKRLEEINAAGCELLSVLALSEGAPVSKITFPANYQTVTLRSLANISRAGLTFENKANITGLWVENCAKLDGFSLFEELYNTYSGKLKYIRLSGLELEGDGNDLKRWYDAGLGGIDAQGNTTNSNCKLCGTYKLTKYLSDDVYNNYVKRFDELNIRQPELTMIEFDDMVADDCNVTNLDNGTGYKSGTTYKPSGHINAIMKKRRRCLGKLSAVDEMVIYPLHDENSYYYADATSIKNATPAKLDSSEGDVWMDEPSYWYKGINDYLNNKKYACFSSQEQMPAVPDPSLIKVIKLGEIQETGNYTSKYKLMSGYSTVQSSHSSDANYAICCVNVTGYKKVRFPTVLGNSLICSLLSDANGKIVESIIVPSLNNKFENGMYLIKDIPASANFLYFTIHINAEFDCVVLSNSNKIEDMEPDWVFHERCLTGVFEAAAIGSKLYSAIIGESSISLLSQADMSYYASQRHMQLIDYEMHKDVANLFFAHYGRRDSQNQCGYGQNTGNRIIGITAEYGMQDTINQNNAIEYAWYRTINNTGEVIFIRTPASCCLGYENWYGGKYEWMDKVSIPNASAADLQKWFIKMPNGSIRKVKAANSLTYYAGIFHQKFMDILFVGAALGNSTTFYCDQFTGSVTANRVVMRSGCYAYASSGVSFMHGGLDSAYTESYIGSRLAFRGKIVKANSISEYKSLNKIS